MRIEDFPWKKGLRAAVKPSNTFSVEELLKNLDDNKKNFVIGGNKLYEALLPKVDILHISHVKGKHQGDIYFPEIDLSKWEIINEISYEKFYYRCYRRK